MYSSDFIRAAEKAGVAKVPHNDANLLLASAVIVVKLPGLFGGRLSACAAPA